MGGGEFCVNRKVDLGTQTVNPPPPPHPRGLALILLKIKHTVKRMFDIEAVSTTTVNNNNNCIVRTPVL